jgi:hypothetical protein
MGKSYLSINFSSNNYPDKDLFVKVNTIVESLTDNSTYTTLAPDVIILKTKNDLLGGFLSRMATGNKQITAEKNVARKDLEDYLHVIGTRVQDISAGDEVLILSSGFDLRRKPAPVGMLDMPAKVTVTPGKQSATLNVTWEVVDKAYNYVLRYTIGPVTENSIWKENHTSKHNLLLDSLPLGEPISIQVAGLGSDPRIVWSAVVVAYCMF